MQSPIYAPMYTLDQWVHRRVVSGNNHQRVASRNLSKVPAHPRSRDVCPGPMVMPLCAVGCGGSREPRLRTVELVRCADLLAVEENGCLDTTVPRRKYETPGNSALPTRALELVNTLLGGDRRYTATSDV